VSRDTLRVRPPAVAGSFYPADPDALRALLRDCFAAAVPVATDAAAPKVLVVPHAGLVYSGPIAASAYRRLDAVRAQIRRVVLLGPSHRVPLRGMAVTSADAFVTPLGAIRIDAAARAAACEVPGVSVDDAPHALEHSLEVQLPFLQSVLDDFALLPVAVGECTPEAVAVLIEALWGGPETLIVVSTDLSHYHRYDEARRRDTTTAAAVTSLAYDAVGDYDACGAYGLRGLLRLLRDKAKAIELLDLRNSGDTAGDRERVVGYGAFASC
jgi:AmmeMemoRadiSam system protein B